MLLLTPVIRASKRLRKENHNEFEVMIQESDKWVFLVWFGLVMVLFAFFFKGEYQYLLTCNHCIKKRTHLYFGFHVLEACSTILILLVQDLLWPIYPKIIFVTVVCRMNSLDFECS